MRSTEADILIHRLGRAIKIVRNSKKMTQKILSKKLNLSQSYLSQIENGQRNISIGLLANIADALSCYPFRLLDLTYTHSGYTRG